MPHISIFARTRVVHTYLQIDKLRYGDKLEKVKALVKRNV